ncbi:hypothetical protein GUITHDRAFT_49669, partial [Guillardia theta CCMP2712]
LAAAAFLSSPFYRWIFSEKQSEQIAFCLQWLFERNFVAYVEQGAGVCTFCGGEMVSFFVLLEGDSSSLSLWDMIRLGLYSMPFNVGFGPTMKMLRVKGWVEDRLEKTMQDHGIKKETWSLQRVVVKPGWQGKGLGSACLSHMLNTAGPSEHGVILTTQEEPNVRFYERLGFETIDDAVFEYEGERMP